MAGEPQNPYQSVSDDHYEEPKKPQRRRVYFSLTALFVLALGRIVSATFGVGSVAGTADTPFAMTEVIGGGAAVVAAGSLLISMMLLAGGATRSLANAFIIVSVVCLAVSILIAI